MIMCAVNNYHITYRFSAAQIRKLSKTGRKSRPDDGLLLSLIWD